MLELNTLPWFWQALCFLSRWGAEKTGELGWKTRGSSVLFGGESRREGDHSSSLTCCPLIFARSPCPGTNSLGKPASLLNLNVLESWNDYQVAHLRGRQEPQGGESNRGQTRSPTAALTPGRAMEPHSEESTVTQRSPPQPQTPDIWALTFRCRHGVFQDRGQARSPPSSPCPSAQSTRSGLSILNVKSTLSLLNIISADRTWGGLNLPCRWNLVRFRLV